MIGWRFATADDLRTFYGYSPSLTMRAIVFTVDDVPAGVIGVAQYMDHALFFSDYRPDFRDQLKRMSCLRAIQQAMQMVRTSRLPVYTVSTPHEPDSPKLIERLGFVHHQSVDDREVYRWPV